MSSSIDILGIPKDDLINLCLSLDSKPFRAKQIWSWMYRYGVTSFDDMSNLSKDFRKLCTDKLSIDLPKIKSMQESVDGTVKWLLEFKDVNEAETVFIPDGERKTICISSQVGCVLNCTFCHTGTQKLVRNLTADEIVKQVMVVYNHFNIWDIPNDERKAYNIVFMGMGEPFYNYDHVSCCDKNFDG